MPCGLEHARHKILYRWRMRYGLAVSLMDSDRAVSCSSTSLRLPVDALSCRDPGQVVRIVRNEGSSVMKDDLYVSIPSHEEASHAKAMSDMQQL